MDIVSVIVTALSLGAAAGLQATTEAAVKDAYDGLKSLIQKKYKVKTDKLEKTPDSFTIQKNIKNKLKDHGVDQDKEVLRAAKKLLNEIESRAPQVASFIGVDISEVRGGALSIEEIVSSGDGVKISKSSFRSDILIKGVQAGRRSRTKVPK